MEAAVFETPTQPLQIVIRDVDSICEMKQVEGLQKEVWGIEDRDVVPFDHLMVGKDVGGLLIGAFDRERLVGFVYGLLASDCDRLQIHSHMLAVKPAYRNFGIGYRLKIAQRERVLARGIARVTWTFDPLRCLNAHLNFKKLGVICDRYKINYYGESTSSFLHQHGTDRLWVTWLVDSARVRERIEAGTNHHALPYGLEGFARLVEVAANDEPCGLDPAKVLGAKRILVEIPDDIGVLERRCPDVATGWREATRWAFTDALAAGYLVEEFYRECRNGRAYGAYVLTLGERIENLAARA
jgi:predicted GNAT superfamily acetyltransferase